VSTGELGANLTGAAGTGKNDPWAWADEVPIDAAPTITAPSSPLHVLINRIIAITLLSRQADLAVTAVHHYIGLYRLKIQSSAGSGVAHDNRGSRAVPTKKLPVNGGDVMDPNPDYDASDEIEYGFNWFAWILRGVYPPPAYPPV